jgi:monoamine oxidase
MAQVVVVGAGAAGLMAALELHSEGHEVVVLEARDRVGGRIRTVRFPDGSWANAGAEWLNTTDVVAHELVARFGLALEPRYGFESVVVDGRLVQRDHFAEPIERGMQALSESVRFPETPWDDEVARDLDRLSMADWLADFDLDPYEREVFIVGLTGEYMMHPAEISLASAAVVGALTAGDRVSRFTEGTDVLVRAMADELGSRVHLGEPVHSIEHGETAVRVLTSDAAYDAAAVVLAVPLQVLHRLRLDPWMPLPWVGQGRGGKLLVPYPRTDWAATMHAGWADSGASFVYESASHQEGETGVLVAYSAVPLAEREVLDSFATWFPDLGRPTGEPAEAWWSSERWSGLTYSTPRPGDLDAVRRMRTPMGRVFLAGEHTELMFGYIESALTSGRRSAHDVMEALQ